MSANETLASIGEALKAVDERVFYGTPGIMPKNEPWRFTFYFRDSIEPSSTKNGLTDVYGVSAIRPEAVPDGMEAEIIEAVTAVPGVRLHSRPLEFDSAVNPYTGDVAESLTVYFCKARKSR